MMMKKTILKLIILILILYLILLIFREKDIFFAIIIDTLTIWLYKVFPPIFIFYILSSILISSNVINYIFILLKPLKKIFKFQTNNAFNLFILSVLIGNPSTSSFIVNYYDLKLITKDDLIVLNKCSSFITPLFIFSLFTNYKSFFLFYLSHIISNFIICFFLTRKNKIKANTNNVNYLNFFDFLNNIPKILFSIASLMTICNILSFSLSRLFIPKTILYFLEIGSGAINIIQLSSAYKLYLLEALISFNGICIHLQVYNITKGITSYLQFLKYRIIQSILATSLLYLFLLF